MKITPMKLYTVKTGAMPPCERNEEVRVFSSQVPALNLVDAVRRNV